MIVRVDRPVIREHPTATALLAQGTADHYQFTGYLK